MVKIIDRLSQGTIGTMRQYRSNVAEYCRLIKDKERLKTQTVDQKLKDIQEANKMLSTLYDMQDRFEKKVVRKEGPEEQEEEAVEIKKGTVTVTVPKKPDVHEDPESLAHSPMFKDMLPEMPVPLVPKKKEPVPEPETPQALKEIFQS